MKVPGGVKSRRVGTGTGDTRECPDARIRGNPGTGTDTRGETETGQRVGASVRTTKDEFRGGTRVTYLRSKESFHLSERD